MNGFLVRHDGALVSIDHILLVQKESMPGGEWNVIIYLVDKVNVQWNKDPVGELTADRLLADIRQALQKAIELG